MSLKSELLAISLQNQLTEKMKKAANEKRLNDLFEAKVKEASKTLESTLIQAAKEGKKEVTLLDVGCNRFINWESISCIDPNRFGGPDGTWPWKTVRKYASKSVVKNQELRILWEKIESLGLRPIFSAHYGGEGAYFGVELPTVTSLAEQRPLRRA